MATENPYDSPTHLMLGRLMEKEGKTEEARREYQATISTDPANAEAHDALKRMESPGK
jgi:TolA-binding protein